MAACLQGNDDLLEVVQGEVDVLCLFEHVAVKLALCDSLGAGEVHQVELGPAHYLVASLQRSRE